MTPARVPPMPERDAVSGESEFEEGGMLREREREEGSHESDSEDAGSWGEEPQKKPAKDEKKLLEEVVPNAPLFIGKTEVGLQSWDVAPTSRVVCWHCNAKIGQGDIRLNYRIKKGTHVGDVKRYHTWCAHALPVETRSRDAHVLDKWLEDDSLSVERRNTFENVQDVLRPPTAGAASSGA